MCLAECFQHFCFTRGSVMWFVTQAFLASVFICYSHNLCFKKKKEKKEERFLCHFKLGHYLTLFKKIIWRDLRSLEEGGGGLCLSGIWLELIFLIAFFQLLVIELFVVTWIFFIVWANWFWQTQFCVVFTKTWNTGNVFLLFVSLTCFFLFLSHNCYSMRKVMYC